MAGLYHIWSLSVIKEGRDSAFATTMTMPCGKTVSCLMSESDWKGDVFATMMTMLCGKTISRLMSESAWEWERLCVRIRRKRREKTCKMKKGTRKEAQKLSQFIPSLQTAPANRCKHLPQKKDPV